MSGWERCLGEITPCIASMAKQVVQITADLSRGQGYCSLLPRPYLIAQVPIFTRHRLSRLGDPLVADDPQLHPVFFLDVRRTVVVDAHEIAEELQRVFHDRPALLATRQAAGGLT